MLTQKDIDDVESVVEEKIIERTSNLPTKDEFYKKMDEVMGELKKIREDFKVMTRKVYRDHEPRISKVESRLHITP